MKTTLELPEELMRSIRRRAVSSNRKLTDEIVWLLEAGMASVSQASARSSLPRPVRVLARKPLTLTDIQSAIAAGGDEPDARRGGN